MSHGVVEHSSWPREQSIPTPPSKDDTNFKRKGAKTATYCPEGHSPLNQMERPVRSLPDCLVPSHTKQGPRWCVMSLIVHRRARPSSTSPTAFSHHPCLSSNSLAHFQWVPCLPLHSPTIGNRADPHLRDILLHPRACPHHLVHA
jgi:hypothetical protein